MLYCIQAAGDCLESAVRVVLTAVDTMRHGTNSATELVSKTPPQKGWHNQCTDIHRRQRYTRTGHESCRDDRMCCCSNN